jgi:hypothetical protein
MTALFHQAELEAYLDEALPVEEMTRIERAIRETPQLAQQLAAIIARRDSGLISLGEVWRRQRLSCPARQDLGTYLLGVMPEKEADYVEFHLEVVGCRYCLANLADLKNQQSETSASATDRRRRYFQTSAGRLRPS